MSWECVYRTPTAEGDHAMYATEYAKFGIKVYGNADVAEKKQFPYGSYNILKPERSCHIGSFTVVPFENYHDVPIFGYLIHHQNMGTLLFSTDSYKIGLAITGISHYLIEANYSDELLKQNVWSGKINKAQADRIMLSHMSLDYCVKYLRDCSVGGCTTATKSITLCHLSERNSDPALFKRTVESAFGIPCYVAQKGTVVELNNTLI